MQPKNKYYTFVSLEEEGKKYSYFWKQYYITILSKSTEGVIQLIQKSILEKI